MAVYVDNAKAPYRRMIMCHMMADTLDELHVMANRIGVARRHFQSQARYPHYDICKSMKAKALESGAREVSTKEMVKLFMPKKWRP